MQQHIKDFFDGIDLIANRLPAVDHLLVQLVLIGLVITGAIALFKRNPH
jgi:hypothetical protein